MKTINLFLDINNNKLYTEKELRKLAPEAPESMNLVDLMFKINAEREYYHIIDCRVDIEDKDIKTPVYFDNYNMNLNESSYAIVHFHDLSLATREAIIEFLNVMQDIKDNPDDIIQNCTQNTKTFETDLGDIFSRWLAIAVNFVSRELLSVDKKEDIPQLNEYLHTIIANQGPLKETLYGRFLQLALYDIEMENFDKYADAIYHDITHKEFLV